MYRTQHKKHKVHGEKSDTHVIKIPGEEKENREIQCSKR